MAYVKGQPSMPYGQHPVRFFIELNQRHPFQVKIKRYWGQVKAGLAPRPHEVATGASWVNYKVKGDHCRLFGFRTAEELAAFKVQWNLS